MMIKYSIHGIPFKHLLSKKDYGYFSFLLRKGLPPEEAFNKTMKTSNKRRQIKIYINGKSLKELLDDARDIKYFYSVRSLYKLTVEEALKRVEKAKKSREIRLKKWKNEKCKELF